MHQVGKPKRGGIVVGPPHNPDGTPGGGVHFPLAGTGRVIEEQGLEINIPHEIRDMEGIRTFKGKNIEILSQILQLGGYSITDKVEAVEPRDVVICVVSAWDDEVQEYTGTMEEILSRINTSKGCKPVLPTNPLLMGNPMLLAEGGPVPELNSNGGYDYYGKDKEIAKKCGLQTLPKTVPGTNCGNCIFWGTGHCSHSKVLLLVTSRQCCKYWDDKSFGSHLRNIWAADFFADKSKDFPLNDRGGYDYSGEALDRAREADLITLPEPIVGTTCAEKNCMYGIPGKCIHPRILLPVTPRQSCAWWDNVDVIRPWGAPVETEFSRGGSIPGKGRKKDWQAENADSPRWQKKKEALRELSSTINRLRTNVSRDITSPDERTALTALAVAIIDKTAERVGNIKSADKGHFGVTGFKRNHVDIVGKKIHFNYKAKKGVPQDKDFSDLRISNALKKAIKNSPKTIDGERNDYLFVTTKGIQTSNKQVNDYVEKFGITAKVMRGYNANRWIIEYLKEQDGSWKMFENDSEKAKKVRKRIFHKALNETAKRVGHEKATLRKHYMIPELLTEYIDHGRIINMKNMGYYNAGGSVDGVHNAGPLGDLRVEKYFDNKNEVPVVVNKATEKIYLEAQDEGIDKLFNAQVVKEVDWKDVVSTQDFLKSSKFNRLKSVADLYSIGLPWAVEYQGKYYINDGHHRAVAMHEAGLPIKLHVYPIESTLLKTGSEIPPYAIPVIEDAALELFAEGSSVEEKIAQRLQQRQKSKEFKDTGIATYTRKYHAAYEIITLSDLVDIEKDNVTAYKLIEKSKIWPLYNVNELREQGNTSGAAYLKVKCREFLSARPLDTKESREVYVKNIESLRSGLESVKTALDVKEYLEAFANLDAVYLGDLSGLRTISYISTTYIGNLKNHSSTEVGEYFDNIFGKKFHNFCLVKSDTARTIFAEAFLYEGYTQAQRDAHVNQRYKSIQDTIKRHSDLKDKIKASNGSNETIKQLIKESGITYYEYNYDKKYVLDWIEKYVTFFNTQTKEKINSSLSKSYTVREEDWSWFGAEKKAAEPKTEEDKPRKPQNIFEKYGIEVPKVLKRTPLDFIKRTGGLAVGDVSTKAVLENYGFKNIIYGNYVNDAESKEHTKHILGAMLDMVELCNIDIKDINKLGGLDINIGSTGCGSFSRASACYFPQLKAINLTKKRGDGSLGHEWSHYLDNILSEGTSKKATNIQYATLNPAQSERVTILFYEYKNWLMNGGTPRKITVTYYPQKKYQFRVYGETLPLAIEGVQRRHAAYKDYKNFDTNDLVRYYGFLAYKLNDSKPLEVELETKATKFWVATSRFSPSDYYLSPKEMFARAFEGWLEYKMQKMGRVNNYLVDIKSGMGLYALVIPRSEWCYPFGEDVIWLDDWFERLFSAIRVDYGISPFTWGTKDRVDEYTDYKETKNEKVDAGVEVNTDGTVIVDGDIEEFEKGYGFRIETLKDGKGENRNIYRLLTDPYSRGKGFAVGGKQSDVFIFALKYFTDNKSGYGIADGLTMDLPNIVRSLPDAKLEEAKKEAIEYFKNNKESKPQKPMTQESDYQPELFAEGGGIEGMPPEPWKWDDIKKFFEGELPSKLPAAKEKISLQVVESNFEKAPFDYLNVRPIPYKLKSIDEPLKNIVGTDELRPAMMGVYYDPEQKQKVATNAHILVVIKDKSITSKKLIDPYSGANILKFTDEDTKKETELRYPNYMAVIPINNAHKIHLTESQVDQLMDELNGIVRAKRFLQGREEQKIIAKITHEDLEIYVNPVFLLTILAALKQYGATEIDLEFSSPNRAIMVIDSRKNGNKGLVMPVMYKDDFIPVKILDDAKVSTQPTSSRPAAPVPAAAVPVPAKPVHKPAPKKDRKKPNTIHSCAVRMGRKGGLASAKVRRMDDGGGVEDMTMEQLYDHVQEVMPAVKLTSSANEIKIFTDDETLFTGDGPDKEKFSVIYLAGLLAGYDQQPETMNNGGGIDPVQLPFTLLAKFGPAPKGTDLRFNMHDEPYLLVHSEDAEAVEYAEKVKSAYPKISIHKYVEGGPIEEPVMEEDTEEQESQEPTSQESPKTCMCFSTYLRTEKPELVEQLENKDVNSTPELRAKMDEAYQAWQGGSMPYSKNKK